MYNNKEINKLNFRNIIQIYMNHQVDHIQHNIIVIPSTLYILYWKVLISLLWPHLITYFTVTTPEWELHHQVLWVLGEICSNCNCSGSQPVSCGVSFSKSPGLAGLHTTVELQRAGIFMYHHKFGSNDFNLYIKLSFNKQVSNYIQYTIYIY